MAHEFHASVVVTLPEEAGQLASSVAMVAQAWSDFLAAMNTDSRWRAGEGAILSSFSINETRAKPAQAGAKRGRRPRGQATSPAPATVPITAEIDFGTS